MKQSFFTFFKCNICLYLLFKNNKKNGKKKMEKLSYLSSMQWLTILANVAIEPNELQPPTNIQIISKFTFEKREYKLDLEVPFHFEPPETDYFQMPNTNNVFVARVARQKVFCCNYKTDVIEVEKFENFPCNKNLVVTSNSKRIQRFKAILKLSERGGYMSRPFVNLTTNIHKTTQFLNCKQGHQKTEVFKPTYQYRNHFAARDCAECRAWFFVCDKCNETSFYAKSKLNNALVEKKMAHIKYLCDTCDVTDAEVEVIRSFWFSSKSFKFLRMFSKMSKKNFKDMKKSFLMTKQYNLADQFETSFTIDDFSCLVNQSCDISNKTFFYIIVNLIENLQISESMEEGEELIDDFFQELQANSNFLRANHLRRLLVWFQHLSQCYCHKKVLKYKINKNEKMKIIEDTRTKQQRTLQQTFLNNIRELEIKKKLK